MNIKWKPDKLLKDSLKTQIIDYFRVQIRKGYFKFNDKLPSERELAELFQVNRSTIKEALNVLKAEGIIKSRGTVGTFIVNNSWSVIASQSVTRWDEYMKFSIHKPNQAIIQTINKEEFRKEVIRLGTGELSPELFPKDLMNEILSKLYVNLNALNYEEPLGYYPLRQELCKYLKTIDINVIPEEVLIVSGTLQGLSLISLALMQPNSTMYVEAPSYVKSLNIFQSAGMKLKGIKMDDAGLDIKDLHNKLKYSGTNILYTIPTFHNPTSIVMSENRREELMLYINENNLPVIEDDVYRELAFGKKYKPLKAYDKNDQVIYMGSLSKSFSPGLRIGWVVGNTSIIERLGDIKMQMDYGTSSLSQQVAYYWFKNGYNLIYKDRLLKILIDKRDYLLSLLEKYFSGIATWNKPEGGFYIWLMFYKKAPIQQIFRLALKKNILLNPGLIYDFRDNNALRLSYAYADKKQLKQGLLVLKDIISDL